MIHNNYCSWKLIKMHLNARSWMVQVFLSQTEVYAYSVCQVYVNYMSISQIYVCILYIIYSLLRFSFSLEYHIISLNHKLWPSICLYSNKLNFACVGCKLIFYNLRWNLKLATFTKVNLFVPLDIHQFYIFYRLQ